jgi:hypothetical protein
MLSGVVRLNDRGHRGLFIYEVEQHSDRLVIRFFTSRPISATEVRSRLHPTDSAGTEYHVASVEPELIDAKGVIEFIPAPPKDLAWFNLEDRPGRAMTWAQWTGSEESRRSMVWHRRLLILLSAGFVLFFVVLTVLLLVIPPR